MSKLVNLKRLFIVAVVVAILGISTSVYATDVVILDDSSTNDSVNVVSDQFGDGADNTTNDVDVLENDTNEVDIDNEPVEDIPDTGKNDTILISIIAVMAVSAIYTYVRVKNYDF